MLLEHLIAVSSASFGGARSDSAVYHLLTGRKSVQTVQDSHLYNLSRYYGIYKRLKKTDFMRCLDFLEKEMVLNRIDETTTVPGPQYEIWVSRSHNEQVYTNYFRGLHYYTVANVFWDRLILLIQTLTNSVHHNLQFIPVTDNGSATGWVRKTYHEMKYEESTYLKLLYNELNELLMCLDNQDAEMIVDSLTGYKQYGMSSFQLADRYHFNRIDVPLVKTALIHRILTLLEQSTDNYPCTSSLLQDMPSDNRITNSARKTYDLLREGHTLQAITEIRSLKLNTIYDHLVEIALYDRSFPVNKYVSHQHREEISAAIQQVDTNKLKDIKAHVSTDISYFEIRLVLAAENLANKGETDEHRKAGRILKTEI